MRYYVVDMPDRPQPLITTNVRRLRDLPEGTTCHSIITDRDGSTVEGKEIPVKDGRVQVRGRGVHNVSMWWG